MLLAPLLNEPVAATQQALGKIFSDEYAFTVPPYQRPYCWQEAQAKEMLADLRTACEAACHANQQETYFLGSIVLIKKPEIPACEIIDGQQRITTLTILLCLLRDLSPAQEIAARNTFICEEGNQIKGTQDRYRLTLRMHDRPFFEKYIQKKEATSSLPRADRLEESRRNIVQNAAAMRGVLLLLDGEARDRLMAFLIQRCFLIVISVWNPESAHRVFRVLNTRGLDLAPTDILKADLLEALPADQRVDASRRWEAYETRLGRDHFIHLFHHIRMIHQHEKPHEALEADFAKVVVTFASNPREFLEATLDAYVSLYERILGLSGPALRFAPKSEMLLVHLRRIDHGDWVPVLLLFLYRNGEAELEGFLQTLERCAYFMFICRCSTNERIGRFAKAIVQVEGGISHASPSFPLRLRDSEKRDFLLQLDRPVYTMARQRKAILLRIDAMLADGAVERMHEVISIEHVVPQTPRRGSEWATVFADEDERSAWLHALGNLVLLPHATNAKAGNLPFQRKKKEYFCSEDGACTFALTTSLMHEPAFDLATLKRRHEWLKDRIAAVWKLREAG